MSLEQVNVIDAMGIDEASGRVLLVIRHEEAWEGSDAQLFLLQEKLNAYLSFALDGEMAEACPDFAGRPLGLRIETATAPDARTQHLLAHVRRQVEFQEISLEVRVRQGAGCGCHAGEG
jgi:hypothetical protein